MAKKNSWKDKYELDTRKEYSYRGTGRSAGGQRIYRNSTVSNLMWLVDSAKRGFESEVQIRPGQAKKFSDLVRRAEAAGGKVTVVQKGQKREFDVKSTGTALFRGGPRVGSAAATSFFEAGGKVKGTGIKAQGSLPKQGSSPKNVLASEFGIMKLGMKTDNPSFTRKKRFNKNG